MRKNYIDFINTTAFMEVYNKYADSFTLYDMMGKEIKVESAFDVICKTYGIIVKDDKAIPFLDTWLNEFCCPAIKIVAKALGLKTCVGFWKWIEDDFIWRKEG